MKRIPLSKGKFAVVDDEDFDRISQRTWCTSGSKDSYYAMTNIYKDGKSNFVKMHRYILGDACKGMVIDHIDGNGLNNQKSNLRICTNAQNLRNRKKPRNNNYPYTGIQPQPNGKWRAIINHNGKTYHLGIFETPEGAALAYDKKAKEFFGEFANLNFKQNTTNLQ